MTEYIDYDDIVTVISAAWNVAVIAKPNFENSDNTLVTKPALVQIKIFESNAPRDGLNGDRITTLFEMKPIAESKVNLDKYLGELRRIINTHPVSNGFWHIDSWIIGKTGKLKYYTCSGKMVLLDAY